MVQSFTEDFRVVWEDSADAQLHWNWDKMHWPRPVPPLGLDVFKKLASEAFSARVIAVNGYLYMQGFTIPQPPPEVWERGVLSVWEGEYVPLIRAACERWRMADYDQISAVELADSLEDLMAQAGAALRYTMVVAMAFAWPTHQLADFCEAELGPEGAQLVATMLQGFDNVSADAGAELGKLAESAASWPEVAAALREERYEELESVTGGAEFLRALRSYLDVYGWRAESWGRIHVPTWAEDSRVPLMLIGHYLNDAAVSPASSMERSLALQRDAAHDVESRLSGEKLAQFRDMFSKCQNHVRISEGRAFWQLTIDGSLRVPFLALGDKLVEAGALAEANDVCFLSTNELKETARDPSVSKQVLVIARKAGLERWEGLTPPPFVGMPPPKSAMPPEMQRAIARFWGGEIAPSTEENVIKGNAASKGVACGVARVVMNLGDSMRLRKGDILVCPSTAPPWTPLFAIAAAIVTDTGGILSHSAICAREYGIPCVVGTQTATQQIADGAIITVDGGEGTVRIAV
jgi:pyruvate,water dikinase